MARVTPLLAVLCWLLLWRAGSGFDFEGCTAPCWQVYNQCRANEQLATCNAPMQVCMDRCRQLKATVQARRLSDARRSFPAQKVKDDLRDTNGDDWDDWDDWDNWGPL